MLVDLAKIQSRPIIKCSLVHVSIFLDIECFVMNEDKIKADFQELERLSEKCLDLDASIARQLSSKKQSSCEEIYRAFDEYVPALGPEERWKTMPREIDTFTVVPNDK